MERALKNTQNQKGFSLVEMTIVIGMTGIILALSFNEIRHLVEKERAQNAVSDLRQIYMGSIEYYDSYGSYSGVSMAALCAQDPSTSKNLYVNAHICGSSNGANTGPWNGSYSTNPGNTNTQIQIVLSQIPPKYGMYIQRELLTDITVNSGGTAYDSSTKQVTVTYYRSI